MPGPLDGIARSLTKSLTEQFGQKVILRTPTTEYTPSTGAADITQTDRVRWGRLDAVRRPDDDGVMRRFTRVQLPADGLYEEGVFRNPEQGDTVVVDADAIFGDDDNPGWTGGHEYRVVAVEQQWANQQVYAFDLILER